ncbi:MAG TPA: hypothetical protein VG125_16250 [Pirellulales bacterium]|jgi:hypothetical protein|nr:hypothetical protein [Pirellulales bacterium]
MTGLYQAPGKRQRRGAKPLAEADKSLDNYCRIWEENLQRLDAVLDALKTQQRKRGLVSGAGE